MIQCKMRSGKIQRMYTPVTTEYPVRGIFFSLEEKVQFIQFSPPGRAGLEGVDPGGVHAGVAKNVRQAGQVPLHLVESPGEEMAEVVREDLPGGDLGLPAQRLHLPPEVGAVQGLAAPGDQHRAGGDAVGFGVLPQPLAQLAREVHLPSLALIGDHGFPHFYGLHGEEPQLADPNPCSADGLHGQEQPFPLPPPGGGEEPLILPLGQLPPLVPAEPPLHRQPPEAAVLPTQKCKELVQGGYRPVGPSRGTTSYQMIPVLRGSLRRQLLLPQPGGEGRRLPVVLDHRGRAMALDL